MRLHLAPLAAALLLAACGDEAVTPGKPGQYNDMQTQNGGDIGKLGNGDGLVLGVGGKNGKSGPSQAGAALGVNAYLWRGALDTLSFMPLVSADPFGGVIITDWFQPPQSPGERFKATAYILGRELRSDGIRVSVFRQTKQGAAWTDAAVDPGTNGDLEDKVLARARELRERAAGN